MDFIKPNVINIIFLPKYLFTSLSFILFLNLAECFGNEYDSLIKISTKSNKINTKRASKLKYKLIINNGNEFFIVIDNKTWSITKCFKRIKSNSLDGDAHFILGVFYSIRKKYKKAIEMFNKPHLHRYTFFTIDIMYEWLGYIYYTLGLMEKVEKKRINKKYISLLKSEQQVYIAGMSHYEESEKPLILNYFYALSFIDLGYYLEARKVKKKDINITMPGSINISGPNESFEYAIKILNTIKIPTDEVYEKMIFLYERLEKEEKADLVRRNREEAQIEEARKMEANKKYLMSRKQKQVQTQILKKIDFEKVFKDEFKPWYEAELDYKYKPKNLKQLRKSDSLIEWKFSVVMKDIIQSYPEAETLNQSSIDQLTKTIHGLFFEKTMKKITELESNYRYQKIKDAFYNREYWRVMFFIDNYKTASQSEQKTMEIMEMKIESLKRIRIREVEAEKRKQPKQISSIQPGPEENDTLNIQVDSIKKPVQATPLYKQIGNLIDELVGKGDYIGAYRGLRAYEKLLKDNFVTEEIDKTIRNIENVIEKNYGKRRLKELKSELRK